VGEQEQSFERMGAVLKKAARVLHDADVPFLLGGSLASWARGGPESRNDLDFMVRPEDAERALEALTDAGMHGESPPEGWLFKACDDGVPIDIIFEPRGLQMTDEVFERGEELEVLALPIRVMAIEDVIACKLHAMDEHELDYSGVLEIARALREQIDWEIVRADTDGNPYAHAFFVLVEELGIASSAPAGEA
jgi:predicted nucleotidyltransferase